MSSDKNVIRCCSCDKILYDLQGYPYYLGCNKMEYHKMCYDCMDAHDKFCTGFVRKVTIKDSTAFDNTKTEDKTKEKGDG